MYTPPFNAVHDEDEIRRFVRDARSAWLVTVASNGAPLATLLPVMWEGTRVLAHMARANPHWRQINAGAQALLIVGGAEAYISPSWYAAKAEHGKVVPTWNYSAVHLAGTVVVREDTDWVRQAVEELTDTHEHARAAPWHVSDAPTDYVEGQLRGIVGIDFTVVSVEGKAKLSQNRSQADQFGVVSGLTEDARSARQPEAARAVAGLMADLADRRRE
jgi:transcriptional regulator